MTRLMLGRMEASDWCSRQASNDKPRQQVTAPRLDPPSSQAENMLSHPGSSAVAERPASLGRFGHSWQHKPNQPLQRYTH
jgi:hypothetical protein